ncbi:MAG: hypothetical protein ACYTEI_13025 [Planctomycetota bacterium]|jgi:hypothetical protein
MFHLSKWYLDCVADNGDAAVLYRASLRWGLLRLHYGASLLGRRDADPIHRYTLRPGSSPKWLGDGELHWTSERLQAEGIWSRRAAGIERTLLDGPRGDIRWNCVCPRADAWIRIGDCSVKGRGYAEHLGMTVRPWRLPFNELHWGRFHSAADTLVWIAWRGASSARWAFLNGEERRSAKVTASAVSLHQDDVTLRFEEGRVLRSGRLAKTALRSLRGIAHLVPRWRAAQEEKRVSQATLTRGPGSLTGWAVHEVVRWP